MLRIRTLARTALIVVCALTTVQASAQDVTPSHDDGFVYYYFDQPLPLTLDTSRISVIQEVDISQTAQHLPPASLKRVSLQASSIKTSSFPGLSYIDTRKGEQSESDVRNLVATLALDPAIDFVSPVFLDRRGKQILMSPYLHIGFDLDVSSAHAEAIIEDMTGGVIEERNWSKMPGVYRVRTDLKDGFEVLELANRLAVLDETQFAESDMILQSVSHLSPNDPYYTQGWLWGLDQSNNMDMDAPEAWDITTGDPGVIVVVLDDGIQRDHPDLNTEPGADFTGHGTNGYPYNGCDNHGTAVAGTISAVINNNEGVVGIAPDCRVASAKYTTANVPCDGAGSFNINSLVNALDWAQQIGARVTNNSNGFSESSSISSKYISTRSAGIVHFASSGNSGAGSLEYPSSLGSVNAVGAIRPNGDKAGFSTYGNGLAFVAPGVYILTTDRLNSDGYEDGNYTSTNGTSFSSPYAAGVAALLLANDGNLTSSNVEKIMYATCLDLGDSGYDVLYGHGLVKAYAALTLDYPLYCDAAGNCNEYISRVQLSTLDVSSGCSDYTDHTAYSVSLQRGESYDITVTASNANSNDQCAIYVDWNRDWDFDDGLESAVVSGNPGTGPFTATLTPPAFAILGETRMRVRLMRSDDPSSCGDTSQGEVEDYTIEILPEPIPDTTAPNPNPMTFSSAPTAISDSQVTMTATVAVDSESPPVTYFFDNVNGDGGHDSGWQSSREYVDTGLLPNAIYSYRIKAQDSAETNNITTFSEIFEVLTHAAAPPAPFATAVTGRTFAINVDVGTNPASTELAILCTSTSPHDPSWEGMFLSSASEPSATPTWLTDAAWSWRTVVGLSPSTEYQFSVLARNSELVETDPGEPAVVTTLECDYPTDCDDGVDCTINSCYMGECMHTPNDALCDDGYFCTGTETCDQDLGCQNGTDPCDGGLCDDELDACVDCLSPEDCIDDVPCTDSVCTGGSCSFVPNDSFCDDGQFCTGVETCDVILGCQNGTDPCDGGLCDDELDACVDCLSPEDCNDDVPCTVDTCSVGECVFTPDDEACDDGQFCNGAEVCSNLDGCQMGIDPCPDQGCDESLDQCIGYGSGNFDGDTDIDLDDVLTFMACFGESPVSTGCGEGDLDADNDVDLDDHKLLVESMTGPH